MPLSTQAAARTLGVSYYQLQYLVNAARIPAPAKNISGGYEWSPEDIERAREALVRRREQRGRGRPPVSAST